MKKFVRFTILLTVLMALPQVVQALPFVPSDSQYYLDNHYYQLRTGSVYLCGSSYEVDVVASTYADTDDMYQWCFVGDESAGYKIYNKGKRKFLAGMFSFASSSSDADIVYFEAGSGNNFYMYYKQQNKKYYLCYDSDNGLYASIYKDNTYTVSAVNVTPQSSNTDDNGVTYSYVEGGGFGAIYMTDGVVDLRYNHDVSHGWVIMQASTPVAVKQYSICTTSEAETYYNTALRSWKLQGSNDKSTWTDIDVRTDWPMPFVRRTEVVFTINSTKTYKYFKFITTAGASETVGIADVLINEHSHTWGGPITINEPTCGVVGRAFQACACGVQKYSDIPATGLHDYHHGDSCIVCGLHKGETVVLRHGQKFPYTVKGIHGNRNSNGTWPAAPANWTKESFDDSTWGDITMPIASPGHTEGPYIFMRYNSNWYGEYNYFYFRRPFTLDEVNPNATFTLDCGHDDNMVVYVNGQEVVNQQGWTADLEESWDTYSIPASVFHEGENVLAVYMQQNYGGAYFDCTLTMKVPYVEGDVNGDGVVDVSDMNAVINVILGIETNASADVTGDGVVDIEDMNQVINIMLGIAPA